MKKIKRIKFLKLILVIAFAINSLLYSQGNVGINISTPHPSAVLELYATDKGFLPPRLTTTQRNAISLKPAGLVIYNSTINCLQYWNSTEWISLCNSCSPAVGATITDCTSGALNGTYTQGTAMTAGNTITMTVNVTQLGSWTASSGNVNGISFTGSGTFTSTGSQTITLTASGTPTASGTFSFVFTLNGTTCARSIIFSPAPINVRIGRNTDFYTIGSAYLPAFTSQLTNTANYGPSGTYKSVSGFTFSLVNIDTSTGAQLKANYDIINTGYTTVSATAASNLVSYVNAGGVLIVSLDSNQVLNFNNICNAFGITGTNGSNIGGPNTFQSSSTNYLSNIIGDTRGIPINGADSEGIIQATQLPAGSTIIANDTSSSGRVGVWTVGGFGGRVIFVVDEGIFRANVSGTVIDTNQEKFLHNLMAYALDKARGL